MSTLRGRYREWAIIAPGYFASISATRAGARSSGAVRARVSWFIMRRLLVHPFRFCDPVTGRRRKARYVAEPRGIAARYAPGDFGIIGPHEVRNVDPAAAYFTPLAPQAREAAGLSGVRGELAIAISGHHRPASKHGELRSWGNRTW
jgi:hypothetical protein